MTTPPLFDDGTNVDEKPAVAQTQSDSPRVVGTPTDDPNEGLASEYDDFLRWKQNQKQAANEIPAYDVATEKQADTVKTGRNAAPTTASKSEVRPQEVPEDVVEQSYVWLVNGEVLLCDNADLPGHAGLGAELGYWEKDGKVYGIVGVYPAETTIKEK
jgi:hypothetical protein